ncbi:restriction endonuclease [Candidatus Woesearchaeota archaeon]|nr:restriction endonuclease [Candidatus Woesearchaeota archaeon]
MIVTTSDFTVQAKVQADEAPIELWNLQTLKSMVRKYFIEMDT